MDDCAPVFREEAEDAGADTEVSESAGDRQGRLPLGAIGEGEPEEEVEVLSQCRLGQDGPVSQMTGSRIGRVRLGEQ